MIKFKIIFLVTIFPLTLSASQVRTAIEKVISRGSKDEQEKLLKAVKALDVTHVLKYIQNGVDPDISDFRAKPKPDMPMQKLTPLDECCRSEDQTAAGGKGRNKSRKKVLVIAKELIKAGAELNEELSDDNSKKKRPLEHVLRNKNAENRRDLCKLLLENQANPVFIMGNEYTPLAYAAYIGDSEVCELLLNNGADANNNVASYNLLIGEWKEKLNKFMPLHVAVEEGHTEVVRLLLNKGASPTLHNVHGHFPIYYTIKRSRSEAINSAHIQILNILLQKDKTEQLFKEPIKGNPDSLFHHACKENNFAVIQYLFGDPEVDFVPLLKGLPTNQNSDDNASLTSQSSNDKTSLTLLMSVLEGSLKGGHTELFKLLLDRNASFNDHYPDTLNTLVHRAAEKDAAEILKLLIAKDSRADLLNQVNKNGLTPLQLACERKALEAAKVLILNGASMMVQGGPKGYQPFHYACALSDQSIALNLLAFCTEHNLNVPLATKGIPLTPLHVAAMKGHFELIDKILSLIPNEEKHSYLNRPACMDPQYDGKTVLHFLAEYNQSNIIETLLRGSNADITVRSNSGKTALDYACLRGQFDSAGKLLERRSPHLLANRDNERNTCLHHAIASGNSKLVEKITLLASHLLLKKNAREETVLHTAANNGYRDTDKLIEHIKREYSQDVLHSLLSTEDCNGNTPLHVACMKQFGIVENIKCLFLPKLASAYNHDNYTPFHCAIKFGTRAVCEELLTHIGEPGVDDFMILKTGEKELPLHLALQRETHPDHNGHCPLVDLLLEHKSPTRQLDKDGNTPLHYAARCGNKKYYDILEKLSNPDTINKEGKTAFDLLVQYGKEPEEEQGGPGTESLYGTFYQGLIKAAGSYGTALTNPAITLENTRTQFLNTLLGSTSESDLFGDGDTVVLKKSTLDALANRKKISSELRHSRSHQMLPSALVFPERDENKAEQVEIDDEYDVIPAPPKHNDAQLDAQLISDYITAMKQAADDETRKEISTQWLLEGVLNLSASLVELALMNQADMNYVTDEGHTPLTLAMRIANTRRDAGMVELLLEQGARVDTLTSKGTPAHWAASISSDALLRVLLKYASPQLLCKKDKSGISPFHLAALKGQRTSLEFLYEYFKDDIDHTDDKGRSALFFAVASQSPDACKYLVEKGADAELCTKFKISPWQLALLNQNVQLVEEVYQGIKSTSKEHVLQEAIMKLAAEDNTELCMALLEKARTVKTLYWLFNKDAQCMLPIHHACNNKRRDLVKQLIKKYPFMVNAPDHNLNTPLHYAVAIDDRELVELLYQFDADIFARNNEHMTPFHVACTKSNTQLLTYFKEKDPTIMQFNDGEGRSLLHYAVLADKYTFYENFKDDFAPLVSRADYNGNLPLHYAALSGNKDIIRWLATILKKEGKLYLLNKENNEGDTPLTLAAEENHTDTCRKLVSYGANIYTEEDRRKPKAQTLLNIASTNNNAELAHLFLNECPINKVNHLRSSALHGATFHPVSDRFGEKALVDMLLEKGAELNRNSTGDNPLHLAIEQGAYDTAYRILEYLKASGKTVPVKTQMYGKPEQVPLYKRILNNVTNNKGKTPFYSAVEKGNVELIKRLIDNYGADPKSIHHISGETGLHVGARHGHTELIRYLLSLEPPISLEERLTHTGGTALTEAVSEGHAPVCQLLIDKGALWIYPNMTCTLLHIALQMQPNNQLLWDLLLNHKNKCLQQVNHADENRLSYINMPDQGGMPVLHEAVKSGNSMVVETLTNAGADYSLKDSTENENTPLHHAMYTSNMAVARILLTAGASLDVKNADGLTALMVPVALGYLPLTSTMLIADPHESLLAEVHGEKLVNFALDANNHKIARLLLQQLQHHEALRHEQEVVPIHVAAAQGNNELIDDLIKTGYEVNVCDENGKTPLHYAVIGGHAATVKHLLKECKACSTQTDLNGYMPLLYAVEMKKNDCVEALLDVDAQECHAQLDWSLADGRTALFIAAQTGQKEVLKTLLKKDTRIASDNDGLQESSQWGIVTIGDNEYTPLTIAAMNFHFSICKKLLAKVNVTSELLNTMLCALSKNSMNRKPDYKRRVGRDTANFKIFLEHCQKKAEAANCHIDYKRLVYEFARTAWGTLIGILMSNDAIDKEALFDVRSDEPLPLIVAIEYPHLGSCKALLRQYADKQISYTDENDETPLHKACRMLITNPSDKRDIIKIVRLLLQHLGDDRKKNAQSRDGVTPLHLACLSGSRYLAKTLMYLGASATICDKAGKSIVDYAQESGNEEMIAYAKEKYKKYIAKKHVPDCND